jgi:hypothetical protein
VERRGFLGAILAAAVAPAIVKAEILMPLAPKIGLPFGEIWAPEFKTFNEADMERAIKMRRRAYDRLDDLIYQISPKETPFLASIKNLKRDIDARVLWGGR